jgi:hypothetical protein
MTPEEFFDAVENDTAPYTIRFRPQYFCPIFKLKSKLRGQWENYAFEKYYGWESPTTINRKTLMKIYGQLHYLAYHAPLPIQSKWASAERRFADKHIPKVGLYWRWVEKHTPNGWI